MSGSYYNIRRFDRVTSGLTVTVQKEERVYAGVLRQISLGGAFIQSKRAGDLAVGDEVTLWLRLEESVERIGVPARIIYFRDDFELFPGRRGKGFGVRFDDEAEARIGDFIDRQRQAGLLIFDARVEEETEKPAGAETVLLVEDEEEIRRALGRTLKRLGYEVLEARNGEEALGVCRELRGGIDLILTDVVMPRVGGPELVEKALGLCPGVKVLFMSSHSESILRKQESVTRESHFLQKPFTPLLFANKIRDILDGV